MKRMNLFVMVLISVILTSYQLMQTPKWVAPVEANGYKNPYTSDTKATEKGGKIYMKLCWSCHGKTGKGDGPAGAALVPAPASYMDDQVQAQSDGALYWKITHGRGAMVSYKSLLSDQQRWMLVNYIRDLDRQNSLP